MTTCRAHHYTLHYHHYYNHTLNVAVSLSEESGKEADQRARSAVSHTTQGHPSLSPHAPHPSRQANAWEPNIAAALASGGTTNGLRCFRHHHRRHHHESWATSSEVQEFPPETCNGNRSHSKWLWQSLTFQHTQTPHHNRACMPYAGGTRWLP